MFTCRSQLLVPLLLAGGSLLVVVLPTRAQDNNDFSTRCGSWVAKHGYSRDHVKQRTGSFPPPRNKWVDNIPPDDLQVGDVVRVSLWPNHVGVIEEIARDSTGKAERLKISSFNYGHGQGWIDRSCDVTVKFGIEVSTWVSLSETTGYWRPPLVK